MTERFDFLPDFQPGTVWLTGAGPGDPGLLTLLASHGLRHADWVVHDALVSAPILALANPAATIESVGKRGGRPSPKQSEINARLIELAGQGHRVLRLKGGDPFVFGRGADEALALLPGWEAPGSGWDPVWERDLLLFEMRYQGIQAREARLLEGQRAWDHVRIPVDFRVEHLAGLSTEVKEKLLRHRPETLGQAARIPGITPAAVTLLHLLLDHSGKR